MQKVYENIVSIIKVKGMTRKEFAQKLIDLQPKVNKISEVPTISTIYGYLNGRISIPIELLSFMAEVLNVTEQELFDTSAKTRKKCFQYFLQSASKEELEYFQNFIYYQINNNVVTNYGNIITNMATHNERTEEIVQLLEYAPNKFINNLLKKLREFKKMTQEEL